MYISYLKKSLQIFISSFVLGYLINTQFVNLQKRYPNNNPFIMGTAQLLTVITLTYILQLKVFVNFFEEYKPNILFSTFLLTLQTNMIDNFQRSIVDFNVFKMIN